VRVGLEVSALRQTRAGVARYIDGLAAGLEAEPGVLLERLSFGGSSRVVAAVRDALWYPAGLPRAAARRGLDVLHCPTYRAPLRSAIPLVETVHDLAVLRHPRLFNRWNRRYSRLVVARAIRAARRVIAVSEFTKRELVELLGIDPSRVDVIGVPPTSDFTPDGPAAAGEYVLAVGTVEPRKNLERLAEAARQVDARLRVVGVRGWGRVELDGAGVEWVGPLGDEQLAEQYRGALCLAYPSLYEGFGIPVLEAMACGTPVVTSAGGATEEVAGGAAVLVDPLDAHEIAAGIDRAVYERADLRERGLRRVRDFDWVDVTRRTVAVYEEAVA
jgi:glycosyltransferase involved in cell wall biosynthesis